MSHSDQEVPKHIVIIKRVLLPFLIYIWGVCTMTFELFPYSIIGEPIEQIQAWWQGSAEGRQLQLVQKLKQVLIDPELHFSGESKINEKLQLPLKRVSDPQDLLRGSPRKLYFYSISQTGYYLFYYVPHFPDGYFGAVVVSAQGEVKQVIKVPKKKGKRITLGQGGVSDDGKLIFNSYFDLYVTNICGEKLFEVEVDDLPPFSQGKGFGFHHKASADHDLLWTWYGNSLRQYNLQTKELMKEIPLLHIVRANPELPIFEGRLIKSNRKGNIGQWKYGDLSNGLTLEQISLHDPFHQNDVDVLTKDKEGLFPQFKAGDLLLSFRSINLIVVIDPTTLKVKWYYFGQMSRQHDPDWGANGEIIVYDNHSHHLNSKIISINPVTKKVSTLINGEEWGFFQFAQGNQHLSQDLRVLFTNNSEAVHATNDRLDFYFKYENHNDNPLDISTSYYIEEEQYQSWLKQCKNTP